MSDESIPIVGANSMEQAILYIKKGYSLIRVIYRADEEGERLTFVMREPSPNAPPLKLTS